MPVNMKRMIAETFADLAKEKNVDKITVKELVEACHISRQTFYYHFQDIMDVIEWSARQVMQQMLAQSLRAETPEEGMDIFVDFAVESSALLRRLMHSQRREQVERMVTEMIRAYLEEMLRNKAPEIEISYADLEIALDFCTYGIAGVLLKSCDQAPLDEQRLVRQLCRLLSGRMPAPEE